MMTGLRWTRLSIIRTGDGLGNSLYEGKGTDQILSFLGLRFPKYASPRTDFLELRVFAALCVVRYPMYPCAPIPRPRRC